MRNWIKQRWERYAKASLLTLIFLSPLAFNRATVGIFSTVKLATIWILGVGALGAWASWSIEHRTWVPKFKLLGAAGIFLVAMTVATIFSQQRLVSVIGGYQRYGGLLSLILYVAEFITIAGLYWQRPEGLRHVAIAWGAAATLIATYVLLQAAGLNWAMWVRTSSFPIATLGNSNFAGAFLGISVPALTYLALTAKTPSRRWLLTTATGLILLALWYTGTRGGMVAAFAGLGTMAIAYRRAIPMPVRIAATAAAVLVIATTALALRPASGEGQKSLTNALFRTESFIDRTHYWGSAIRIFRDHPIVGTGPETFSANYPRYRSPAEAHRNGVNVTDKPHEIFLEYAAGSGILGLGSYLALVGLALAYGWRRLKSLGEPNRLLLASFIGALTGYLAQGLFSIDVPPLALTGWVAIGAVAVFADPVLVKNRKRVAQANPPNGPPATPRKHLNPPWWVHATIAVGSLLMIVPAARFVLADVRAHAGEVETQGLRSLAFYKQAVRLNPYESDYPWHAGLAAERAAGQAPVNMKTGLLAEARQHYDDAIALRSNRLEYLRSEAALESYWAIQLDSRHFDRADKAWKIAIALDPNDAELHRRYGELLKRWASSRSFDPGILSKAVTQLRQSLEFGPDNPEAWMDLAQQYHRLGQNEPAITALGRALHKEISAEEASQILPLFPESI